MKMDEQEKNKKTQPKRRSRTPKSQNSKSKATNRNNKNEDVPGDMRAFYKHPLVNGDKVTFSPKKMTSRDEVPGDLNAFFGHPLVNGEDTQASALALLHEYQNLPAIDRTDGRIGDKLDGLSDLLRQEAHNKSVNSSDGDYSVLLNSDVDAFLNRSNGSVSSATKELEASPQDFSNKSEASNLIVPSAEATERLPSREGSPKGTYSMYEHNSSNIPLVRSPLSSPSKVVDDPTVLDNIATFSPASEERIAAAQSGKDNDNIPSRIPSESFHLSANHYGSDSEQIVPNSSHIFSDTKNLSHSQLEVPQAKKKKERTKSILAEALTSGVYTPPNNICEKGDDKQSYVDKQYLKNSTTNNKKSREDTNQALPPPPPYSANSAFPLQGLNLPPISAICQQIQKEHPQIAAVPLAIIEKSLLSLGFPTNSEGELQRKITETGENTNLQGSRYPGITSEAALAQALTNQISALAATQMSKNTTSTGQSFINKSVMNIPSNSRIQTSTKCSSVTNKQINEQTLSATVPQTQSNITTSCESLMSQVPNQSMTNNILREPSKPVTSFPSNSSSYLQYSQYSSPLMNNVQPQNLMMPKTNSRYPQFPFSTLEQLNIAPTPTPSKPPHKEPVQSFQHNNEQKVADGQNKVEQSISALSQYPQIPSLSDESQILSQLLCSAIIPPQGNGPVSHVIVPKSLFNMATQRMGIPVSYASASSANEVAVAAAAAAVVSNTSNTSQVMNEKPATAQEKRCLSQPDESSVNNKTMNNHSSACFPTLTSHLLGQSILEQRLQSHLESVKDYSSKAKMNQTAGGSVDNNNVLKRPNFLPVAMSSVTTSALKDSPVCTPDENNTPNSQKHPFNRDYPNSALSSIKNSPVCTPDESHLSHNQNHILHHDYHNINPCSNNSSCSSGRQSAPLFQQQLSMSLSDMYRNNMSNQFQQQPQMFLSSQKNSMSEPNTPVYQPNNPSWIIPAQSQHNREPHENNLHFNSVTTVTREQSYPATDMYPSTQNLATQQESEVPQQHKKKRPKLCSMKKTNKSGKTPVSEHPSSFNLGPLSIVTTNITPIPSPGKPISTSLQSPIPPFRHPLYFSDSLMKESSLSTHYNHLNTGHHFPGQISPISSQLAVKKASEQHTLPGYSSYSLNVNNVSKSRTPSPTPMDKPSNSTKKIIQVLTEKMKQVQETSDMDDKSVSYNDISDLLKQTIHNTCHVPTTNASKSRDFQVQDKYSAINTSLEPYKGHDSEVNQSFTSSVENCEMATNGSQVHTTTDYYQSKNHNIVDNHNQSHHLNLHQYEKDTEENRLLPSHLNRSQYGIATSSNTNGTECKPSETIAKDNHSVRDILQCQSNVLVIKPQGGPSTPPPMHPHIGYHNELKSPDSGFNESCVSPCDGTFHHNHSEYSFDARSATSGDALQRDRVLKRRRSMTCVRPVIQTHVPMGFSERRPSQPFSIPKIDPSRCSYRCYLDTPISASQKIDEDKITYLNKGQYYNLIVEYKAKNRPLPCSTVKSMVVVMFRDEKCVQDELRAWQFWHSRQHTVKQRIIDIDHKSSSGVSQIDEISHNAVTFMWKPQQQKAEISITINCLSTDFSNQKGVKGLPLHVQVDTFENESDPIPVHRAYCQLKVFCDKGAERKARDEERKKEAKTKQQETNKSKKKAEEVLHPPCDVSEFYDMADLVKQTVLFSPAADIDDSIMAPKVVFPDMKLLQPAPLPLASPVSLPPPVYVPCLEEVEPAVPAKRQRTLSQETKPNEKVLLYVRERHEAVFTALLLLTPTMFGLVQAVEEKYGIPAIKIRNIYKRSHKGILVKMDDNIIRHYSNEATFIITINRVETPGDHGDYYNITLMEIDSS